MEVILISGISLSLFIVVLILTKRQKSLTDRILATWIIIIGIHLLGYYFNQFGYWERYPHLIGVTAPFPLLHGPMLFLYTLYSLRNDRKIRLIDNLHFVPVVVAYLYMSNFFFFYSAEEKTMLDHGEISDYQVFSKFLLVAMLISGLTYAVLAYRLTIKHKHKIDENYSYHEGISIRWLRNYILSIGLVFFVAAGISVCREAFNFQLPTHSDHLIYLIIIGFVFYIGYFGIKQENIFTNQMNIGNPSVLATESAEKYRNSGVKKEAAAELYDKLLKIMVEEKPFLEPKLSLTGLAQRLEISPNQLSQIINQESGVNFHDFINQYRIQEFIGKSQTNKNYSLLALALDSGFNSKSSFNTIFKKLTGQTPSRYLSTMVQMAGNE